MYYDSTENQLNKVDRCFGIFRFFSIGEVALIAFTLKVHSLDMIMSCLI